MNIADTHLAVEITKKNVPLHKVHVKSLPEDILGLLRLNYLLSNLDKN